MGHDFVAQVEQHSSQTDAAQGFGGKFGVQKDRMDKVVEGTVEGTWEAGGEAVLTSLPVSAGRTRVRAQGEGGAAHVSER